MARFVFRHFVDGVVNGVEAELLSAFGEFELAGAGARFGVGAHLQIRLRIGGEDFAEQFREFGGVFRFFERVALKGVGDFRISFAFRLAAHGEVHADLGAFAGEVVLEALHHLGVLHLAGADLMLARLGLLAGGDGLLLELGAGNAALRALLGGGIADVDVSAHGADVSFHFFFLLVFAFVFGLSRCSSFSSSTHTRHFTRSVQS